MAARIAPVVLAALVVGGCATAPAPRAASSGTASAPAALPTASVSPGAGPILSTFPVPSGMHPHDVAPARDGGVWFTAQGSGELGWFDPVSGDLRRIRLGTGSAPHGVIVAPDGAPWITDGGLNAIVRVDPESEEVRRYDVPAPNAGLNTATFDRNGVLWFTGQGGLIGRLDPATGAMRTFTAPRGSGPYGIATTVVCPGFAVDCLETLEEIDIENRDGFLRAGGQKFHYVPALNARAEHARFLSDLIARHCQGWTHVELGRRPAGAARGASA